MGWGTWVIFPGLPLTCSASEQAFLLCFVSLFATEEVGRFKGSCCVNGSETEEGM